MTSTDAAVVRLATADDVPDLTTLINRAFEVERFFKGGDRITSERVARLLERGAFLVLAIPGEPPVASVYVEVDGERGYFGLLSVEPGRQGQGLGGRLVTAAEDRCRAAGCTVMDIRVVNLRTELPPRYRKLGYVERGTEPYTDDDPTILPIHFILMRKPL